MPQHKLEAIIAGTLNEINNVDEDEDVDENDPDLLSELNEIAGMLCAMLQLFILDFKMNLF